MAKLGFEYSGDTDSLNDNSFDRQPLPDGEYNVNRQDKIHNAPATFSVKPKQGIEENSY